VALGARFVPAGQLGLLIATEPVFIIALTLLLQRQPIHRNVIIGSAVALTGVAAPLNRRYGALGVTGTILVVGNPRLHTAI
jgi:drug/metabolite transporter (DMT)-like permease